MKASPTIRVGVPANDVVPLPRPSPREVLGLVGPKNLERAAGLARWAAIFEARVQGRGLRALCEGSRGETWQVAVRFGDEGAMAARCSCPAAEAGPCKHVGALLLTWHERPEDFAVMPTFDEALEALEAPALRGMLGALARRRPELDPLLHALLPPCALPPRAVVPASPAARIGALFRRAASEPGVDLVAGVGAIADACRATHDDADHLGRARLEAEIARAVLGRIRRAGEAAPALRALARTAIEAMAAGAQGLRGDPAARRAVLRAMVEFLRFDIEQGTAARRESPGRFAVGVAARVADRDERALLAAHARARGERADAWAQRAWAGAEVELLEGVLDDETWFARCREHQHFEAMARRLLDLGRGDEALAAAAQLGDDTVLALASPFIARGLGARFEALVSARIERATERQRGRLVAWLQARAEARHDASAALAVAERVFRARPDRASWEALRAAAVACGVDGSEVERGGLALLAECMQPLLAEVLLERGALAAAADFVTGPRAMVGAFHDARAAVATALEAAGDGHRAAAVLRAQAEVLVAQRSRAHYGEACRALARARNLLAAVGEAETAARWVLELHARHSARPALRQLLGMHFGDLLRAAG